jgi:hypothetical protein
MVKDIEPPPAGKLFVHIGKVANEGDVVCVPVLVPVPQPPRSAAQKSGSTTPKTVRALSRPFFFELIGTSAFLSPFIPLLLLLTDKETPDPIVETLLSEIRHDSDWELTLALASEENGKHSEFPLKNSLLSQLLWTEMYVSCSRQRKLRRTATIVFS